MIAGGTDGDIRLISIKPTMKLGFVRQLHSEDVGAAAVASDGSFVSVGWDGIMLFSNPRGTTRHPFDGGLNPKHRIFLDPEGQRLLVGDARGDVHIWNTHEGRHEATLAALGRPVAADWTTGTVVGRIRDRLLILARPLVQGAIQVPERSVRELAFDVSGRFLAVGACERLEDHSCESTVALEDLLHKRRVWRNRALDGWPAALRFSPDSSELSSASNGRRPSVAVWDVATGQMKREFRVNPGGRWAPIGALSDDGRWVAVQICSVPKDTVDCVESEVQLWDTQTTKPLPWRFGGLKGGVASVAFSPNSSWIAAGGDDGVTHVWDVRSQRPVLSLPPVFVSDRGLYEGSTSLAFMADHRALVATGERGELAVWDLEKKRLVVPPTRVLGGGSIAVGPLNQIATANQAGEVLVWDMSTRELVAAPLLGHHVLQGRKQRVRSLAFSADGMSLVAGADDNGVIRWSLPNGDLKARACSVVNRDFTDDEWQRFMGGEPRHAICEHRE